MRIEGSAQVGAGRLLAAGEAAGAGRPRPSVDTLSLLPATLRSAAAATPAFARTSGSEAGSVATLPSASGAAVIGSLMAASPAAGASQTAGADKAAGDPSILHNLETTNEEMVHRIGRDVVDVIEHPIGSLLTMVDGMSFPLLHPIAAAEQLWDSVKADPLDGSCDAIGTIAGSAYMVAVGVAAVGALAAPFTGGASLAVAASALAYGNAFGLVTVASDAGGMLLHEVRGAEAKTDSAARSQGDQLASYTEDEALNVATWNAGTWVQDALGGGDHVEVQSNVTGDIIGSVGIYDAPPVRFRWFKPLAGVHVSDGQVIQNDRARRRMLTEQNSASNQG